MSRERPLPGATAVRLRRDGIAHDLSTAMLDLRLCPWFRWRRRAQLRRDVAYLEGMAEGLRLVAPRPDPSQASQG